MNRYNEFVKLSDQLKDAVAKMEKAKSSQEVEKLQLTVRESMKGLMMVLPFVEPEIAQYALKNTQRINVASVVGK